MPEPLGQTHPSIAVVVVTWNGAETSRRCLRSLREIDYPNFRACPGGQRFGRRVRGPARE